MPDPNDALLRKVLKELESLRGEASRGRKVEVPISLGSYLADFIALPGLVGVWPMSSIQRSTGLAYDLSSQARHLTYNGNPVFGQFINPVGGLAIPYLDFDGTGDFLSRADETDLDILGTETIFSAGTRGITFGGWCWWDVAGTPGVTTRPFITKAVSSGVSPYQIYMEAGAGQRVFAAFSDSSAGINAIDMSTPGAVSLQNWHCVIAKCVMGGTATLMVDGNFYTTSASGLASLYDSNGAFEIGRGFATNMLDGRAAICFL